MTKRSAKHLLLTSLILLSVAFFSNSSIATDEAGKQQWTNLLDKDLSQWENYLAYEHKPDYNGKTPTDENGKPLAPVGYNKDTKGVFKILEEKGDLVLKVSGEIYGCVFTKQEYENFHLKLKVKWGDKTYGPRVGKLKDSGILYFSQGEAGVDYWRAWMLSQEFQIMEGHIGDYWNISTSAMDIRAFLPEGKMNSIASVSQPFLSFGSGTDQGLCLRSENQEKPNNDWNTVELVCYKGKSLHIVNGRVVMVLQNSRYIKDGKPEPLTHGKIQLQSEGSEVYFKDIQIQNISSLPKDLNAYYN